MFPPVSMTSLAGSRCGGASPVKGKITMVFESIATILYYTRIYFTILSYPILYYTKLYAGSRCAGASPVSVAGVTSTCLAWYVCVFESTGIAHKRYCLHQTRTIGCHHPANKSVLPCRRHVAIPFISVAS